MVHQKKNKKRILYILMIIELVIASFNIFLVIPKKDKTINNIPEISNVAQTPTNTKELEELKKLEELKTQITVIEKLVINDVVNKNISVELNGNYKYKSIIELVYEGESLSSDKELISYEINGKSKSELEYELHIQKHRHFNEYISINNGYFRTQNNNVLTEEGFYYGNTDKSYAYIKNPNGNIELNGNYYSITYAISQTGYWLRTEHDTDGTKLYIRQKILCDGKYLLVTYEYELINYN